MPEVKTGIDWEDVRKEILFADWEDVDDGNQERRVFLGTVFGLMPSGKYYTPIANSNVAVCECCKGSGRMLLPRQRKRRWMKKWERELALHFRFRVVGTSPGGSTTRVATMPWSRLLRKNVKQRNRFVLGATRTLQCPHCGGVGSREAYLDELYREKLEEEAEERGLYITSGEGDPCDIFAGENRDKPNEEEE